MKRLFPGSFVPSTNELLDICDECTLIIDSSVFLSLYSRSKEEVSQIISALKQHHNLLWIPYQAAKIYLDKRDYLISEKVDELNRFKQVFNENVQLLTGLITESNNPIMQGLHQDIDEFVPVIEHFTENMDKRLDQFTHRYTDLVIDEITGLLHDDSIGSPVPYHVIDSLPEEAEKREAYQMPPFIDHNEVGLKQYQTILQWIQMVTHVKKERKPALFITADYPSDWWKSVDKDTYCSRAELINELNAELSVFFHIIDISTFLEVSNEIAIRKASFTEEGVVNFQREA